jgi:hypothetical protein
VSEGTSGDRGKLFRGKRQDVLLECSGNPEAENVVADVGTFQQYLARAEAVCIAPGSTARNALFGCGINCFTRPKLLGRCYKNLLHVKHREFFLAVPQA